MKTIKEVEQVFAKDRFIKNVGVEIVEIKEDQATLKLPITDGILNANDVVQGGALYTLADYAFSVHANAVHCPTVTASGSIDYIHPARGAFLTAVATLKGFTRRTCVYAVDIYDENGGEVAFASFTGAKLDVK